MFLARIDGTLTSTVKHETLEGCRFLIGQRLDAAGDTIGDPLVLIDTLGAARGATVMVTTDNETLRNRVGKNTPARLVVVGLVDEAVKRADGLDAVAAGPQSQQTRRRRPAGQPASAETEALSGTPRPPYRMALRKEKTAIPPLPDGRGAAPERGRDRQGAVLGENAFSNGGSTSKDSR